MRTDITPGMSIAHDQRTERTNRFIWSADIRLERQHGRTTLIKVERGDVMTDNVNIETATGLFWLLVVALVINTIVWLITAHSILPVDFTQPYQYGV